MPIKWVLFTGGSLGRGRMRKVRLRSAVTGLVLAFCAHGLSSYGKSLHAAEPDAAALEKAYPTDIRPLVTKYCQKCHSADLAEAEVDLEPFTSWEEVRKHPRVWQKVGEMLETGQMPPKDAKQPTDAERTKLRQWVRTYLTLEAAARAGDPGRVVLRRLSNAEYTNTVRDLTGLAALNPAREFPVDGAAGEGFTNTGNALVMSPALLTKYLDAAKEIADHLVLLPGGVRFSPHTTRRDWTDDTLAEIRKLYSEFSDSTGGTQVNLQGIISDTNQGGRLPVEKYLRVTLLARDDLQSGKASIESVAKQHGVNAKYLGLLWNKLTSREPSLLLDGLRSRWKKAKPDDAAALAAEIAGWQGVLWKFNTVGQIGKVRGPKAWMESVDPVVVRQELRYKIPATDAPEVTLSLVAADAGAGSQNDFVVWEQPRIVVPGRPDLLLRDVRDVTRDLTQRRTKIFAETSKYLNAASEALASGPADLATLSKKHNVEPDALAAWLDYLGIGTGGPIEVKGHFTTKLTNVSGYEFASGWGSHDTPLLVANSSDQHVRIPGNLKPHSVTVHPSPTLRAVIGWKSPVTATMRIEAKIMHAHPECGNGVTWALELRRAATRQRLANGIAHGANEVKAGPLDNVRIQKGDLVSLLIGPRDGNHSCDLTAVDVTLIDTASEGKSWNLAADVSPDVLAGNPHKDRQGNDGVWHFYVEAESGDIVGPVIPAGSLLTRWQAATLDADRQALAGQIQKLLTGTAPAEKDTPDAALYRQLSSLGGPLLSGILKTRTGAKGAASSDAAKATGPDPALFGKHPNGSAIDSASLCVDAPNMFEVSLPADLVAGGELVTTGVLDQKTGAEGTVQLEIVAGRPQGTPTFRAGPPILVHDGSAARKRVEAGLDEYRQLFPAALCYTKIVPVDEVVTLTLFYREDDHLCRLMLDDVRKAKLDTLWDELHFVSQDYLTLVDALAQLIEYATQDADPTLFEPLRGPYAERAAAFRSLLVAVEPKQLDAVLALAPRVYRRPVTGHEIEGLKAFYQHLRQQELPHDEALRLTFARMLVAPEFLYKIEKPTPGTEQKPVNDWELASRLSYFLWSSQPDDALLQAAASGKLQNLQALLSQTQRMLQDPRVRRMAIEFACQWLHIYEFDHLDEKSERHFPAFVDLRGPMYEESIQFFTHMFQNDGSVLDILDADHTFVNDVLAKYYGVPLPEGTTGWKRVDGVKKFGRGGILGQATTLAKQSGASRTSPILRGNWISEVLLGERLPRPPKDVPQLPDDEAAIEGLTVRQLVEKHSSDPKCAVCHQRIDAFGFSLEGYDAIGGLRQKDLADRPIETRARTMDGAEFEGLAGLRNYLLTVRRDAFVRQFCKKLLGYSLGRAVQLSDEPLLTKMQDDLKARNYRISAAIEAIVLSKQFREIRGQEAAFEE